MVHVAQQNHRQVKASDADFNLPVVKVTTSTTLNSYLHITFSVMGMEISDIPSRERRGK